MSSPEEKVVTAAFIWFAAYHSGSVAQVRESEDNLCVSLEELRALDAGREKPKWTQPRKMTLGLDDADSEALRAMETLARSAERSNRPPLPFNNLDNQSRRNDP